MHTTFYSYRPCFYYDSRSSNTLNVWIYMMFKPLRWVTIVHNRKIYCTPNTKITKFHDPLMTAALSWYFAYFSLLLEVPHSILGENSPSNLTSISASLFSINKRIILFFSYQEPKSSVYSGKHLCHC